jgi:transposase InsO family protein
MASRLVFSEFRPTLAGPDAIAFVHRETAFFAQHGIRVERILTDNGSAYRSHRFAAACHEVGLRHTRTKVRHP